MTDANIDHILTLIGMGIAGFITYQLAAQKARVEDVRRTLNATTAATDVKLAEIKHLANGSFGAQMRLTWMALQSKADATNDPADREAAIEARRLYDEHVAQT